MGEEGGKSGGGADQWTAGEPGHRRGPELSRVLQAWAPGSWPASRFQLSNSQILLSHPLLPSKTIARTTARTGSDRMSLMAAPEGSGNRGGGWGDQWRLSSLPQGPSTPLRVLLVCVSRVPSQHRAPTWIRLWTALGVGPSLYCLGRGWGKFTSLPQRLPWHLPPCAHPPFPLLSLAGGGGGQVGHCQVP